MCKLNFRVLVAVVATSVLLGVIILMMNSKSHGHKVGKNFSEIAELIPKKDKPVLLHVFATWCKTCKQDVDVLKDRELHEKYEIVGLLWRDSRDRLAYYLENHPQIYDRVIIDDDQISFALGVIGVPETFIFDKSGTVIYNHIGTISNKEVLNVPVEKY